MPLRFDFLRLGFLLSSSLLAWCLSPTVSAMTVLDDFGEGSISVARLADAAGFAVQPGLDPAKVIGGRREITVGEFGTVEQVLSINADRGELTFQTGDTPGYFTVQYGTDAEPLDVDLTAGGANAFVLEYSVNPALPLGQKPRLNISVTSPGRRRSVSASAFAVLPEQLPNGRTRVVMPFSLAGDDVDFTLVNQLALETGRFHRSTSVTLHRFALIPEPASLVLVVVMAHAVACSRFGRSFF